jgi:hypothetical protein
MWLTFVKYTVDHCYCKYFAVVAYGRDLGERATSILPTKSPAVTKNSSKCQQLLKIAANAWASTLWQPTSMESCPSYPA